MESSHKSYIERKLANLIAAGLTDFIHDEKTIAKLCRVSRTFQILFTPYLCRDLSVYRPKALKALQRLPLDQTLTLEIGPWKISVSWINSFAAEVAAALRKSPNLQSLVIRNLAPTEVTNLQQFREKLAAGALSFELRFPPEGLQNLTSLSLIGCDMRFLISPRDLIFRNLRTIEALRLTLQTIEDLDGVANIVASAPKLTSLSISERHGYVSPFDGRLLGYFATQVQSSRRLPNERSRLSELSLGKGFVPSRDAETSRESTFDLNSVAKFTDLHCLKGLHLGNINYLEEGEEILPFNPHMIARLSSLKRITVDDFTRDIAHLIQQIIAQPGSCLEELEVLAMTTCLSIPPSESERISLISSGTHWKRLSIGGRCYESEQLQHIYDFAIQCKNLEELILPDEARARMWINPEETLVASENEKDIEQAEKEFAKAFFQKFIEGTPSDQHCKLKYIGLRPVVYTYSLTDSKTTAAGASHKQGFSRGIHVFKLGVQATEKIANRWLDGLDKAGAED